MSMSLQGRALSEASGLITNKAIFSKIAVAHIHLPRFGYNFTSVS